jgi:hypothetical protein
MFESFKRKDMKHLKMFEEYKEGDIARAMEKLTKDQKEEIKRKFSAGDSYPYV